MDHDDTFLTLKVTRAEPAARFIHLFELADPGGADLPSFTPGAHIKVRSPAGLTRQYSLSNDPAERHRYVIAVKREADGRGGLLSEVSHVPRTALSAQVAVNAPENQPRPLTNAFLTAS